MSCCFYRNQLVHEYPQRHRGGMLRAVGAALDVLLDAVQVHKNNFVEFGYDLLASLIPCSPYVQCPGEVEGIGLHEPARDCSLATAQCLAYRLE